MSCQTLSKKQHKRKAQSGTVQAVVVTVVRNRMLMPGNHLYKKPNYRIRCSVDEIHECWGDIYFRHAYRMTHRSFWRLHRELSLRIDVEVARIRKYVKKGIKIGGRYENLSPPPIPNGVIDSSVRLACAVQYFSGGSFYDIMGNYGLSHTEVLNSVWSVVGAVNRVDNFKIEYPAYREKQCEIAAEFKAVSSAGSSICAGAIDGILIWVNKPTDADAEIAGVVKKKFFCGRKNKFGLNRQAVSDRRVRILDISIGLSGATSDLLAFEGSTLLGRLENGLLEDGLCLFGDNAYLNSSYMTTPQVQRIQEIITIFIIPN